ncbi:MAG TPA: hypothetical protein PKM65_16340 [Spirochaetota bacterium]|nr:hypothetical protein [Spirochaetota bacterium]HNT11775.1 hypothetical protein [Spirochaetota bacterium]HNV47113.1 hypothetical protein [Spirochaetota bacterium]HPI23578.1 hypothetical protein [Spirochaetota bacterium]HPU88734.1 hypothetical protein [Spirochaetota bacterium]
MKNFITVAVIVACAFAFTACGQTIGGQIKGDKFVTEGWVDDNTFRTTATGVPKKGLTNKTQRRLTAREAALLYAQKTVLEKFKGARIEGASGMADGASTGIAIAKEFGGLVRGGSVQKETYNDGDECEVVYEITAPGLKKRVIGGAE